MTSNDTPRTPRDEDLTRDDDLTQPLEPVEVSDEQDETRAAPADAGSSDAGTPDDAGTVGATTPLPARDETLVLPTTGTTRPLATSVPTPAADVPADAPRTPAASAPGGQTRPGDGASASAEHRPTLRVGTVVWGLVLAAIGVGLLAWAGGASIDVQLATIVLLAAAGTALLVGSLVSSARRRR